MGEIGVAVVVPLDSQRPPRLADLHEHGRDRLAHHKMPEALLLLDELPLTAMEKLDRGALAMMVGEQDLGSQRTGGDSAYVKGSAP